MNPITQWIIDVAGLSSQTQSKIITSLILILLLWLTRKLVLRMVWKRTEDVQQHYKTQKITTYVTVTLGVLLVGRVWFEGIQSLSTFLGLVTAGLAIALQDIVKSFAGWLFIMWRKPFKVGDRIQIGGYAGDVIDIRVFKFTLMEIGNWVDADQSTGRLMHLPNSMALTDVIANYSQGFQFIWHEIPVLVTFESNWEKAKGLLADIAERHAAQFTETAARHIREATRRYMISSTVLTPAVYTTVKDSGVLLTVRYLIDPRQRRGSEQAIWEDILIAFAQCDDVDFAYPSQRMYLNLLEGKPNARAPVPFRVETGDR